MNIFNDFNWHSASEPNAGLKKLKKISSLKRTAGNLQFFKRVGKDSSFLIHKSTKALWKFSEDGTCIIPVFKDDVLTEADFTNDNGE